MLMEMCFSSYHVSQSLECLQWCHVYLCVCVSCILAGKSCHQVWYTQVSIVNPHWLFSTKDCKKFERKKVKEPLKSSKHIKDILNWSSSSSKKITLRLSFDQAFEHQLKSKKSLLKKVLFYNSSLHRQSLRIDFLNVFRNVITKYSFRHHVTQMILQINEHPTAHHGIAFEERRLLQLLLGFVDFKDFLAECRNIHWIKGQENTVANILLLQFEWI